jgi:hypothetical protein
MRSHGNTRAKELYGGATPPNGFTPDDAAKWRQYLTDKYVHQKYAPSIRTTTLSLPKTSPLTPTKLTPRVSKNTKFTNEPMPDIDLIRFDSPGSSPTVATKGKAPIVSPNQSRDFFADFGL